MVEFDIQISAKDLYDYMLRHSYNSPAGLLGSCVGAFFVIYAVMSGKMISLVFGVVLLLYLPWTLFLRSRQQALTNPVFKKPMHYVLDEEGYSVSQGDVCEKASWDQVVKVVSTGRSIIVYTSHVNASIFPRKQMGEKTNAAIEMISTHVDPKKVKIRY
ncbi:MAG: YcxB family protein [Acetatifactor sp.]|nr:YcxB family protein [Acetatifactor sp.]